MSSHSNGPVSNEIDYRELALPMRLVAGWVIALFVGLAGVLAFVYFVYGTPRMVPVPELVLKRPMNQPVLQSNGVADLKAFIAQQDLILSTYAWVNKAQGVVRVPVERAIELVLQKGLPSRGGKQ